MAGDENTPQAVPGAALPRQATDDEIRGLVDDILADRVVTVLDAPAEIMRLVFLPAMMGAYSHLPKDVARQVIPFAVLGKHATLGCSINGYPVFTEIALWRLDDFMRAVGIAREAAGATKSIVDAAMAAGAAPAPRQACPPGS